MSDTIPCFLVPCQQAGKAEKVLEDIAPKAGSCLEPFGKKVPHSNRSSPMASDSLANWFWLGPRCLVIVGLVLK